MLLFISGVMLFLWFQICHGTQLTDGQKKAAKIKASFGNPFQKVVVYFIVSFIKKKRCVEVYREMLEELQCSCRSFISRSKKTLRGGYGDIMTAEKNHPYISEIEFFSSEDFSCKKICGNAP